VISRVFNSLFLSAPGEDLQIITMQLQLQTWPEVDAIFDESRHHMPIGSTEQHGPTGLIGQPTTRSAPR
jgi:hypothetical protein